PRGTLLPPWPNPGIRRVWPRHIAAPPPFRSVRPGTASEPAPAMSQSGCETGPIRPKSRTADRGGCQMADDEDEIILSELSDEDLVLQMHDDLYDGMKPEIEEGVNILLGRGWAPYDVLT